MSKHISQQIPQVTRVTSMCSYNQSSNGCFAGECFVETINGMTQFVEDIKVGDYVKNGSGTFSRVTHVLKTILDEPIEMNSFKSGLVITPYHPIFISRPKKMVIDISKKSLTFTAHEYSDKLWTFPLNTIAVFDVTWNSSKSVQYFGKAMYDFVLDSVDTVQVNGVTCVTLGHSFSSDVVGHEYLNLLDSNSDGYIVINQKYFTRDPVTNKINGIKLPTHERAIKNWNILINKIKNTRKISASNKRHFQDDFQTNKKIKVFV